MEKLKKISFAIMGASPFILSNTVIFIPYLLFADLSDGQTLEYVLPFVLFYTFRMTGIFLLRSFKLNMDSFNILIASILLGGIGSVLGSSGFLFFPLYFFAAICIGLSAAWLPAANTTVNFHEKQQGFSIMSSKKYPIVLLLLSILIWTLLLPANIKMIIVFLMYALFYLAAYFTVRQYPGYEIDFNEIDQQDFSLKELLLFLSFFVLLIFMRIARLLINPSYLSIGVLGFSVVFVITSWSISRKNRIWKLPTWLNLLTFVNGMCLNFILLFGTFYVAIRLGNNQVVTDLYIPYALGIILATALSRTVHRRLPKVESRIIQVLGLMLGLFLLFFKEIFPFGVLLLSFFTSGTGSFLNRTYYSNQALPTDQRIIAKYSTQAKGSITHQFLLMSLLSLMASRYHAPLELVLQITSHKTKSTTAVQIVEKIHFISICMLLVLFLWVLYEIIKSTKKTTVEHQKEEKINE